MLALPLGGRGSGSRIWSTFDGVRGNDLVGYGLVVGLNGTGDGLRNAPFTEEIMSSILERLGVNVTGEQFRPKNVAAVFVTATLPPFARAGSTIDVTVSAIGDATSLLGGTLMMTPLNAADGDIYAVAQGTIIAGGVSVTGDAAWVTEGVPTAGSIPSGGRVEREIEFEFGSLKTVRLALREPDFTTAARIEKVLNDAFGRSGDDAGCRHGRAGHRATTHARSAAHALGLIENLEVTPEQRGAGGGRPAVRHHRDGRRCAHRPGGGGQGNLTLRIEEAPLVAEPNPFSQGETVVVPRIEGRARRRQGPAGRSAGRRLAVPGGCRAERAGRLARAT